MAKGKGGGINIVLSADADALKKGLAEARAALSKTADMAEADQKRLAAAASKFASQAANAGTLRQQGRALQNLAGVYQQMGKAGEGALRQTLTAARENKDAMEDLQQAVMAGTIEGKFQVAAQAIQGVVQVMAGVKGAMIAMGMSTEDAQEAMAKLQGMMAMSQGIAALIGLDGAIKALIPSIGTATAGLTGFKAALASTGIGLAAVAIGYIAMEMVELATATDAATAAEEARQKALEETLETYNKSLGLAKSNLDVALLQAEAEGASEKELHDMKMKFLQNEYDTRLKNFGNTTETIEALNRLDTERYKFQIEQAQKAARAQEKIKDEQKKAQEKRDAEDIKQVQELGKIKLKTLVQTNPTLYGAMSEKEFTKAMHTNRAYWESATAQNITNYKQYVADFQKQYMDAKEMGNILAPPAAAEVVKANFGKIVTEMDTLAKKLPIGIRIGGQQMVGEINGMVSSATDAIGQLAEDLASKSEYAYKDFGNNLLLAVAGFMQTLGKAIIAAGIASKTFQEALLVNPVLAVGAGVALVAAAGAVKGIMKRGVAQRQTSSNTQSASGDSPGIRMFAEGGIISGPTVGMMGEYPGAKSNPEVVAPLNKLKDMIGGGIDGGQLMARISGQDLLIMLDRAETYRGRVR
jgi:hypothetical protein